MSKAAEYVATVRECLAQQAPLPQEPRLSVRARGGKSLLAYVSASGGLGIVLDGEHVEIEAEHLGPLVQFVVGMWGESAQHPGGAS